MCGCLDQYVVIAFCGWTLDLSLAIAGRLGLSSHGSVYIYIYVTRVYVYIYIYMLIDIYIYTDTHTSVYVYIYP